MIAAPVTGLTEPYVKPVTSVTSTLETATDTFPQVSERIFLLTVSP